MIKTPRYRLVSLLADAFNQGRSLQPRVGRRLALVGVVIGALLTGCTDGDIHQNRETVESMYSAAMTQAGAAPASCASFVKLLDVDALALSESGKDIKSTEMDGHRLRPDVPRRLFAYYEAKNRAEFDAAKQSHFGACAQEKAETALAFLSPHNRYAQNIGGYAVSIYSELHAARLVKAASLTSKNSDALVAAGLLLSEGRYVIADSFLAERYFAAAWQLGDSQAAGLAYDAMTRTGDRNAQYFWSLRCVYPCARRVVGLEGVLTTQDIADIQSWASNRDVTSYGDIARVKNEYLGSRWQWLSNGTQSAQGVARADAKK
jgi:hypothetical protein